jgi:hypothetical protein
MAKNALILSSEKHLAQKGNGLLAKGDHFGDSSIAVTQRSERFDRQLEAFPVCVEAKDEKAAGFYRDFGFESLPSRPLRPSMPATCALAAIERGSE